MKLSALPAELEQLSWPVSRLGEAIEALTRSSGLSDHNGPLPAALPNNADSLLINRWIDAAAHALGIEAEPIESSYAELDNFVKKCAPALLQVQAGSNTRFLVVAAGGNKCLTLLDPSLTSRRVSAETIRSALCREVESSLVAETNDMLERAGIADKRHPRALAAILREQLAGTRVSHCWLLRLSPGASLWSQVVEAHVPGWLLVLLTAHSAQYLLWLLSWWMIGQAALQGHFDWGWLVAWALVLFSMIPFRLLVTWWQGLLALRLGALLKRRLLFGVLQLQPEEIRHQGAGQLLGCVIESEAVESLALSGGFLALMSALELLFAAAVMAFGPGGALRVVLLAAWLSVALVIGWHYSRKRDWWTKSRLELTNDLVERMVGHRTRLAQESPEHWHDGEDEAVSGLQALALSMDRASIWLVAIVPRGWLVLGLLALAPGFVVGNASPAILAVGLGGVLLAFRALQRFAGGLSSLAGAWIAWKQVASLFQAAGRATQDTSASSWNLLGDGFRSKTSSTLASQTIPTEDTRLVDWRAGCETAKVNRLPNGSHTSPLLEGHQLNFAYRSRGLPVLRDCDLVIRAGDRVILEGPSGGGKSTLASILARQRAPDSGLLLLGGLDRQTIGLNGWRRHVASAPQFHENHVLTGTFAFNLLMARQWPPTEADLRMAEAVCQELGLGELLQRMPAGLMQLVGETGWQLSQGEKSRLYIARALLQGAELVILDESFGALDPATMQRSLKCVLSRAPTLLVVAHP